MDTALLLRPRSSAAAAVRAHFESYLNRAHGARRHRTIVIHDGRVPDYLCDALADVSWTRFELLDARQVTNQASYLQACQGSGDYLSVHELVVDLAISAETGAVRFAKHAQRCDFTSYEFPRFSCTDSERDLILLRHFAGRPLEQRVIADRFFDLLGRQVPYEVTVRSGVDLACELRVVSRTPWLELCGPLMAGDLRFTPGCELFYAGTEVSGEIAFGSGLNIVPLKCDRQYSAKELEAYARLLELSCSLAEHGLVVMVENGRIGRVDERGSSVSELLSLDPAYRLVNEVGIGLNAAALPLVKDWAATSNEAVPGMHLGLGADPGNRTLFDTAIHFDFVEPAVQIEVNGELFYSRERGFLRGNQG